MKNVMDIDGYKALIAFDPYTNQFRGEFVDLNGGADFYAVDVKSLKREGKVSLKVFLDVCREGSRAARKLFGQVDGAFACGFVRACSGVCGVAK